MVGRGDLQETTKLIGEATPVVLKLRCGCGCAAWQIRTHFIKKSIIFLLKVKKLVKPVIDIGR